MRIGLDANEANLVNRVGSNQFAYQVLTHLYKMDSKNNYFIYLKCKPVADMPRQRPGWHYRVITPKILWTQWRLPLSLFIHRPRPDVFLSLGHYGPRFSPLPTLVTILDLAYLKFPDNFLKKDLFKLKHWTKSSVEKAVHVFTISQSTKKDIQKYYHLPASKITVIYPGIDQYRFSGPQQPTIISQPYLLYLGTLQPRKNLENLVLAYSQLPQNFRQYKLVIAGKKGWLYQPLFALVKKLNLEQQIIFPGFVPNQDLVGLIQKADVFILPSFYEGFGIPVVQAMAAGTLVLVAKNSSLKEIVKNHGLYIQPPFGPRQIKTALIRALSLNSAAKVKLIQSAQSSAQQFSWHKAVTGILATLNSL